MRYIIFLYLLSIHSIYAQPTINKLHVQKIAVLGGINNDVDPAFLQAAKDLGTLFTSHNVLYFNGYKTGMLGALLETTQHPEGPQLKAFSHQDDNAEHLANLQESRAGKVISSLITSLASHQIFSKNADRKEAFLEGVDTILLLPCDLISLDEFLSAWTKIAFNETTEDGVHNPLYRPLGIIVNINGYFDPLLQFIQQSKQLNFTDKSLLKVVKIVNRVSEIPQTIRDYFQPIESTKVAPPSKTTTPLIQNPLDRKWYDPSLERGYKEIISK